MPSLMVYPPLSSSPLLPCGNTGPVLPDLPVFLEKPEIPIFMCSVPILRALCFEMLNPWLY